MTAKHIKVLAQRNPADLLLGVSVNFVVESTGFFRRWPRLHRGWYQRSSSPLRENVDGTFVMGVNEADYDNATMNIVSNASTNCLASRVRGFGYRREHRVPPTGDRRVLDAPHRICVAPAPAYPEHDPHQDRCCSGMPGSAHLADKFDKPRRPHV